MPEKVPSVDHEHLPTKMGTEFIMAFYRLLKGTTLYNRNNIVIDRLTQECLQVINDIMKSEGRLSLKIVRDNLFFNNHKIHVKADYYSIIRGYLQEMRNRWIGELEFTEEVNGEHLKDFIYLLSGLEEKNEINYLYVNRQLEYRGIDTISVGKLEFFKDEEIYADSKDKKRFSDEVYFKSIGLVKEVVDSVRNQKVLNVRKAKRLMQGAVNAIMQDESSLLGLANIKNYDEHTFNHSVNVAIYAMAIGQRLGVPKKYLSQLGMAGLFHDIGKVSIPKEMLDKNGKLSPEELAVVRSHPIMGAETVMRMKEWGELSTRMIDAAFEHHLKYDLSGYPRPTQKRKITLFGKIVALADFYDVLVRPRGDRRFPYVSEKILGLMLERSGKDFDPALVKVFINMIGVFPLGTLALLNTNEMGIVVHIQEDSELIDRPKVMLLQYSDGEYQKGEVVDLRELDEKTGEFKRTIVKTLDPNDYHINVGEYLI
jgi:putative nucleotidyltransferase with HDIG domain